MAARVLDLAETALERAEPVATDFLNPAEKKLLFDLLHYVGEIKVMAFGGYHQAERVRLVLLPAFFLPEAVTPPLAYLEVKCQSKDFRPAHSNLLGSLTGLGIKRGKIGDILPADSGAQVIIAKEIEDYVLTHLNRVGAVPVAVAPIDPEQLNVQPQRVKEVATTVASLRLDAVAGAGFGVSRTKMAREIKAERVKVNWKVVTAPDYQVGLGDTISIRGRGRVVVSEIKGKTKKGRLSLVLQRLQ